MALGYAAGLTPASTHKFDQYVQKRNHGRERDDESKSDCSVATSRGVIGRRWKGVVLYWLLRGTHRLGGAAPAVAELQPAHGQAATARARAGRPREADCLRPGSAARRLRGHRVRALARAGTARLRDCGDKYKRHLPRPIDPRRSRAQAQSSGTVRGVAPGRKRAVEPMRELPRVGCERAEPSLVGGGCPDEVVPAGAGRLRAHQP